MSLLEPRIKVTPMKKGKLLATAVLEFGDKQKGFTISGFKVLHSQFDDLGLRDESGRPLWVGAPSYVDGLGRYRDIFFATPEYWKQMQKMIVGSYLNGNASA